MEARRLPTTNLPQTKADLLRSLVEGTIHVSETAQYREYQNLLKQMEEERHQLYLQSLLKSQTKLEKELIRHPVEEPWLPDALRSSRSHPLQIDESSVESSSAISRNRRDDLFYYYC